MCKRLAYLTSVFMMLGPALAGAASPGPVGWWKLDEMAGTVAADSVAGNDGVITGDAVWTAGKLGGALQFDGTDDFVTLPIGSLINTLGDTTISTWANFSNAGGAWQRIFDFGSGSGASPYMFLTPRIGTNGQMRFAIRTATVGEQVITAPATLPSGWHHVAVTFDSGTMQMRLYLDGTVVVSGPTVLLPRDMGVTTQNWLGKSQWPDALYYGALDDFRIYDRTLSADEIRNAMQGGLGYGVATSPSIADKAVNILPDVVLSWTPGQQAETHDVYLGTVLEAVGNADTANPLGVLVSPGQEAATYDAGRLMFGTTYYWRVDEVSADATVYKGNVWSFTVEPFSYAVENVTATASSSNDATMGPEKTVDGSGLNATDQHSTKPTDMWLSSVIGPQPTWIQYAFDRAYKLDKMFVWNSNQALESIVGYGAKDIVVEYSTDGSHWMTLGSLELAQAPGEPTYGPETVDLGPITAQHVRLTIDSNWGGVLAQYGLSEVRFLHIPVRPTSLSPASGTLDVKSPVTLSWRPGREAVIHEVYLGTDPENLSLVATTDEPRYDAVVSEGYVYYWKVVEVNEAADPPTWESDVLSFSTEALPKDPGTDNLMHHYTFEDGTANDSMGTAHGTLVGDAKVVNGSLVLDGNGDCMSMPAKVIGINTYPEVSIVCTFTSVAGGNTGFHMIAAFGEEGTGAATWAGYKYLFLSPARGDNVSRVAIQTRSMDDSPWDEETGISDVIEHDDGLKHQFVCIVNATDLAFYIDGKLIGRQPLAAGNEIAGLGTAVAYLGKGVYPADPLWAGAIHEFSIYNKALSAGEVRYLAGER